MIACLEMPSSFIVRDNLQQPIMINSLLGMVIYVRQNLPTLSIISPFYLWQSKHLYTPIPVTHFADIIYCTNCFCHEYSRNTAHLALNNDQSIINQG